MSTPSIMRDGPFGGPLPGHVPVLMRALADGDSPGTVTSLGDEAVAVAMNEGLGPVLGARVAAQRIAVPSQHREALLWEHKVCIAENLIRVQAVRVLYDLCESRAIPLLLLKGMALIQSTFASGERSMGDVDVLVPPSRWLEACALVRASGFKDQETPGRRYTTGHDYVRSFSAPELGVVEIHRFICEETIFAPDYEGRDGLFARAERQPSGLLVPEAGDLFLTLVAHAAKHTFELPLRSYLDGLVLLRRRRFSVEEVAIRAQRWGMETAFRAWMSSLRRLEGEDVEDHTFESASIGRRWSRFVWSRTTHASAWQRFVRLAWLMDTGAQWRRHVATRSVLRAKDALLSRGWIRDCKSENLQD